MNKIKIKTNWNLDEFIDKGEEIKGDSLTEPDDDYTVPELIYLFQTGQRRAVKTGGYDYEYDSEDDYANDDLDIDNEEPTQVFDKDVADAQVDLERMQAKVAENSEKKKARAKQVVTSQSESAAKALASNDAVSGADNEHSEASV